MNKKQKILLTLTIIVTLVSIGLVFVFDNKSLTSNWDVFQFYLLSKIGFLAIFIAIMVVKIVKDFDDKSFYPMVGISFVTLFAPLLMRAFLNVKEFQSGACIITVLISVLALLIFAVIIPGVKNHLKKTQK